MKIKAMNGVQYPVERLMELFSSENMKKYYARIERDHENARKQRKGQLDLFEGKQ